MVSWADVTLKIAKTLSRKNIHVLWKTLSKFCFKDTKSESVGSQARQTAAMWTKL
jgi:hypothetical protein